MRILGLVPARGGSKGVPGKNLREVAGKSLLAWTLEAAVESSLDAIVVSTDDGKTMAEATRFEGVQAVLRPDELATDTSPVMDTVLHHLAGWDAVCLLQPTNPLRTTEQIEHACEKLRAGDCDSVISFSDVGETHPARMAHWKPPRVVWMWETRAWQHRQTLPKMVIREGGIYLALASVLRHSRSFQGLNLYPMLVPRSVRIDDEIDLATAEVLLTQRLAQANNTDSSGKDSGRKFAV